MEGLGSTVHMLRLKSFSDYLFLILTRLISESCEVLFETSQLAACDMIKSGEL